MRYTDCSEYGNRRVGAYMRQLGLAEYQGRNLVFCQSIFFRNEMGCVTVGLYSLALMTEGAYAFYFYFYRRVLGLDCFYY